MTTQVIAGRYRLQREVGRGGMGSVWLCRDERLGRDVAIKQLGGVPGEDTTQIARALREARHSAALNHPNVVSVFDAVEEDGHVWLVMEYVQGRSLAEIIASGEQLTAARLAGIGAQVAEGLRAAHERGTIHRDVKPGNILVRDDGVAKIADFGIARSLDQEHLTRTGLVTGTPAYFAPELARGEDPSTASDVWALGASLYAAVEGQPPYRERANAIAMLTTIASEPPPRPQQAGELERPIARMMDVDPESRWTMAKAAQGLRRIHDGNGQDRTQVLPVAAAAAARRKASAPPTEPTAPGPRRPSGPAGPVNPDQGGRGLQTSDSRRRGGWIAVAIVLLICAVAAGFLLLGQDDGRSVAEGPVRAPSQSTSPEDAPSETGAKSPRAGSTPSSTPSPSPTLTPTPTEASSPAPSGDAAGFVESYYALLPGDIDAGWAQLSPALQDQIGFDSYRGFWSTIDAVQVDRTRSSGPDSTLVDLTYTTDGRSQSESRLIEVERDGDGYVISGDQVQ